MGQRQRWASDSQRRLTAVGGGRSISRGGGEVRRAGIVRSDRSRRDAGDRIRRSGINRRDSCVVRRKGNRHSRHRAAKLIERLGGELSRLPDVDAG